ncbi:MAG: hypothetical protein OQL10_11325 [Sedimenticola sp.]|nr:hypothetical protein [Sedimenticola sp.]MCW8947391.1 hypothetical protein [Sedimenticola sp.]MCW8976299.1 hypothetical protein [Sedimenticola sp.]
MSLRITNQDAQLVPGRPLWHRVPTTDPSGRCLNDFMLLIPGLKQWPQGRRQQLLDELQQLFETYAHSVVFADLNLKLNLLWVSHRQGKGITLMLFQAIRERVPEAVLVASQAEAQLGWLEQQRRKKKGLKRLLRWIR